MLTLSYIVIFFYGLALLMIFLYSISQLVLLINFNKAKKRKTIIEPVPLNYDWPSVTVQLPVYNEEYVMERLLQSVAALDYPADKLEIQVLDDSTDSSLQDTQKLVDKYAAAGINMHVIHRTERSQFKAGALKHGLTSASGEFIAIFDADFLPAADWLKKTVTYFQDKYVGVVQTRWGHINRDFSLITKVQAFALDAHFTLEQSGRFSNGHFINFNGTAGIWRKECILDAGNWRGDTLTEDLDLSYRAQLKGWKFKYVEDVVAPAELPVVISAARSQQFRWNKGGAENFLKMFWKIIKSKGLPVSTKMHGILHLANSTMFFFVLIVSVLSVPMLYIKYLFPQLHIYFEINGFFVISTIILFICHWGAYRWLHGNTVSQFGKFIRMFLTFFTVALGFSLHNSLAVAEAYVGKKSDFIRTPKFNVVNKSDNWRSNKYLSTALSWNIIGEIFLLLYFVFGFVSAFVLKDFALLPFHLMLILGFGFVVITSLKKNN